MSLYKKVRRVRLFLTKQDKQSYLNSQVFASQDLDRPDKEIYGQTLLYPQEKKSTKKGIICTFLHLQSTRKQKFIEKWDISNKDK